MQKTEITHVWRARKWVKIAVVDEGEWVKMIVTDSGRGIPAEIRDKVMMPFFTTKPVGKGTGLVLSIVSGILQTHHGKLEIDVDHPNTSFVVCLPKKQPSNSQQSKAA